MWRNVVISAGMERVRMQSGEVTYMGRDRSRIQEGSCFVFVSVMCPDRMWRRTPQVSKRHRYKENETGTVKNIACVFVPCPST